ncbi:hypothetical protein [Streptomyces acidiscabies]|uniref:hypothetical protein n=1 Tax=Streptomyces acidiscabies TaxID=42234 RepID=UPI0038F6DCF6
MHSPRIHRRTAGLAAVAGLLLTLLLGVPTAQAAQTPDSASPAVAATAQRAQAGALVNSPGISPAAERVRYVSSNYDCPYGRLCARVWDPNAGQYKVFDLYRCATYSLSYWNGIYGGFYNNQTTGTVAVFYDQNGGVVHRSTAYGIAPAYWDWGPVWKIKNC